MASLSPQPNSSPRPTLSPSTLLKPPEAPILEQIILRDSEHGALTDEIPIIIKGFTNTHLGTTKLSKSHGRHIAGHASTANIDRHQPSYSSSISPNQPQQTKTRKRDYLKNLFKKFKKKENVNASRHPLTSESISTGSNQQVVAASAQTYVTAVSLDPLASTLTTQITTAAEFSTNKTDCSFRTDIFSTNEARHSSATTLPTFDARISNTIQLAYCYGVLSRAEGLASYVSETDEPLEAPLDDTELEWANNISPIAHEHYRRLINKTVKVFANDLLKGSDTIAEIVLVGHVLDENTYRALLSCFISEFERSVMLNLNLLQGLVLLVECTSYGYLIDSDLVRIATVISKELSATHTGASNHHSYLTWAFSRILDVMVAGKVRDLNRNRDHQPMLQLLASLKDSNDLYLNYQASYAYQALQYIPDDETPLQIISRYAQGAAQLASVATSILKIDPKVS
ncbi:hypothetical protein FBU30_003437 [Linnemannia zychae]|nr:hypothetical protein FBU30_003437 [Linnemannia zychae]